MPKDILEIIIEHKKKEVLERKIQTPLESFINTLEKSNTSFYEAIKGKNRVHLIAEIKKSSPSEGIIVKKFELEKTIRLYNRYASAISVLTDEKFFSGSFYNLEKARKLSYLPILCKDFIIDEYQIYEARKYGANAILLIATILNEEELSRFYKIAQNLNMDALFEVHNEEELKKVLKVNPKIIGINNRNLKDFSIDHELTEKLSKFIPEDCLIVAESGISKWEDVENIKGIADTMLVGTSIMKNENPLLKIEELTQLPRIKICGITNTEDALEAVKCGASYLGLIFAPSPRKIDKNTAKKIILEVRKITAEVKIGGIFVNDDNVYKIANELSLDFVQLHGDENNEEIKKGKKLFKGEIWKSIPIPNEIIGVNEFLKDIENVPCNTIVFDTKSDSNVRGGTGKTFNWNILKYFPRYKKVLVLAGGINPENIQEARDYADIIDISSGVEKEKGKKDFDKIRKLFWEFKR